MKTGLIDLGKQPTPADLLRLAREAVEAENRLPEAVTAPSAAPTPDVDAPAPPSGPVLFNPNTQLYAPIANRFEWFTMPGGGQVCVHPASSADTLWVQRQVLRELKIAGLLQRDGEIAPGQGREYQAEAITRAHIWCAVAVCRQGESLESPKVFGPEHAEALRANPGWAGACEAIYEIAVRLGQGESEAAALRRLLADFFGETGAWMRRITDGLSESAPTSSLISRFATCASSAKPPEMLIAELRALMAE